MLGGILFDIQRIYIALLCEGVWLLSSKLHLMYKTTRLLHNSLMNTYPPTPGPKTPEVLVGYSLSLQATVPQPKKKGTEKVSGTSKALHEPMD